jgi:hypothetical protein
VKPFLIALTLVRVKDPEKLRRRQEQFGLVLPKAYEVETVLTNLRGDQIFSVTPALAAFVPPGAQTLVGVNGIGEFMVTESVEDVLLKLTGAYD